MNLRYWYFFIAKNRGIMRVFLILFILFSSLIAKHTTVHVRLSWLHQFQFAGFYIAKEKGYYAENGLEVNLHECCQQSSPIDEVMQKKMHFGVGKSSLIIEKAKGKDIIALAALSQHAPSILISTNPNIQRIEDLRDKKIMITDDEMHSLGIQAMLASKNIYQDNFIRQKHSFKIQDLIDKKTDAMASYSTNEPYILEKKGIDFTVFSPKDYGLNLYGDILFTSKELTQTNPILVQKFYEATLKGWKYAFENIDETAKIIYDKYNTQEKTLKHLIYEGKKLKNLAFDSHGRFGALNKQRLCEIVKIYKLFDVLPKNFFLKDFLDPLGLGKKSIHIGVLAKRGKATTIKKWQATADYLNENIPGYHFRITPLHFDGVDPAIKDAKIDFLLVNTLMYIQMAHKYGISRIATLLKKGDKKIPYLQKYGSVIIAKKENDTIGSIIDLTGKNFGAVHPKSFGGWVMARKLLQDSGIEKEDLNVQFLGTHDNVVYSVLSGKVSAGSVRTNTLEKMAHEGKISLDDFKIVSRSFYKDFPYLISTDQYPEWPFARLKHTSHDLSKEVLAQLLNLSSSSQTSKDADIFGWTIPLNYSSVQKLLEHLRIYPYELQELTAKELLTTYRWWFILASMFLLILLFVFVYIKRINKHLSTFNEALEKKVEERTKELNVTNKKLQLLAHTDELTKITNRRYFLQRAEEFLLLSQRNNTPLAFLSLDIDHFKRINDEFGHHAGDKVLQNFTDTVNENLRKIDLFGRIGGEEFAICLQNTDQNGAKIIAEKIRKAVEKNHCTIESISRTIGITVSIGVAEYSKHEGLNMLMQKADNALYKAKNSGRNKVILAKEIS